MTKYMEEHNFNFDNVYDSQADNNIVSAHYYLKEEKFEIVATTFVVACQALETSRL